MACSPSPTQTQELRTPQFTMVEKPFLESLPPRDVTTVVPVVVVRVSAQFNTLGRRQVILQHRITTNIVRLHDSMTISSCDVSHVLVVAAIVPQIPGSMTVVASERGEGGSWRRPDHDGSHDTSLLHGRGRRQLEGPAHLDRSGAKPCQ